MHIKTTNIMRNEYDHQQLKNDVELVRTLDSLASIFVCCAAEGDVDLYTIEKGLRATICEGVESRLLLHP